jgi:hypothetical protein
MSATKARPVADAAQTLTERALRQLIDRYRDHLDPSGLSVGDLPWIGGIYGQVRQGFPLNEGQVARVSKIRGELARRCRWKGTASAARRDRDGAA